MTTIRARAPVQAAYRQRNRTKIRADEQRRRDAKRGGPRMCSRCGLSPAVSVKHHYCEECKAITQAAQPDSRWPHDDRPATERGYRPEHAKTRAKWAKIVAAGDAYCVRCQAHIAPGSRWHLDHKDDRSGYLGPSHARCKHSCRRAQGQRPPIPGRSSVSRTHDPLPRMAVDPHLDRWGRPTPYRRCPACHLYQPPSNFRDGPRCIFCAPKVRGRRLRHRRLARSAA